MLKEQAILLTLLNIQRSQRHGNRPASCGLPAMQKNLSKEPVQQHRHSIVVSNGITKYKELTRLVVISYFHTVLALGAGNCKGSTTRTC